MKTFFSIISIVIGFNASAAGNPCEKSEQQGLLLLAQSISKLVIGTPVYSDDFNTRIFHITKSGDTILSVGGFLHENKKPISIHGLLECNSQTGEYELAGAGITDSI